MSEEHFDRTGVKEALEQFAIDGSVKEIRPYGNGHINDTFLAVFQTGDGEKRYILQRMNHNIFKNPPLLMENVVGVTDYLRKAILAQGGDPDRETLNVVRTLEGKSYYEDQGHSFWRVFLFVEGTLCLEKVESPKDFYNGGAAFGDFQRMLAEYPAGELHETIPNFHNTPSRFQDFRRALEADRAGRAALVRPEIEFALSREEEISVLTDLLKKGELPLRVTHNDTKLNNILFDRATGRALCVIDLDTVMPGLSLYDFGDSIRFGASTGAEDERDLSRIELDLELFEAFTEGFLKGCGGKLTRREIEMFPMGAKLMTYECGIRFLGDFLEGDVYFKVHRENHNLDRARTQFKLVADMEKKWEQMVSIVEKHRAGICG